MHQISIEQARADFDLVYTDILLGEEVMITDHEKAVAKVIPLNGSQNPTLAIQRTPGGAIGMITYISEDFDETPEGFEDYM